MGQSRGFIAVLLLTLALCGCTQNTPSANKAAGKRMSVITTLFPLYDFARNICGDKADVRLLLPPGVEAHGFEPKPSDLVAINKADVFVYTNAAMEPWAVKLLKGVASPGLRVVDASQGAAMLKTGERVGAEKGAGAHEEKGPSGHAHEGHDHGSGMDPHLWLDFKNAAIMVDNLAAAIIARDPVNESFYRANAVSYKAELQKLDAEFSAGLARCDKRVFLHGGHYTFGYLAARYGLTYRSAQAVNPDSELTAATLVQLLKLVKANGLLYVYSEELVSPQISEVIAREAGVKILMLHGAHNISKDDLAGGVTFLGLMRKNLQQLRIGLVCR